jgi:putative transposase
MKKSRFSQYQIIKILKEVETDRAAKDVCRQYGINNGRFLLNF